VRERVHVRKLPVRTFRRTVRAPAASPQGAGDLRRRGEEEVLDLSRVGEIGLEGRLGRDRLRVAPGLDRSSIAAMRELVQMGSSALAQRGAKEGGIESLQVPDRPDPEVPQALRRARPDPPEPSDGKRGEERDLLPVGHHGEPVRLAEVARHLREELVRCDSDGDDQAGALEDLPTDAPGDRRPVAEEASGAAHIEKRLVERERLHEGSEGAKDLHHLSRCPGVARAARGSPDPLWAAAQRLDGGHRGVDSESSGLVAGGRDDPPWTGMTDDQGESPQGRVVEDLDRREERIEIGVEDAWRVGGRRVRDVALEVFGRDQLHEHLLAETRAGTPLASFRSS